MLREVGTQTRGLVGGSRVWRDLYPGGVTFSASTIDSCRDYLLSEGLNRREGPELERERGGTRQD